MKTKSYDYHDNFKQGFNSRLPHSTLELLPFSITLLLYVHVDHIGKRVIVSRYVWGFLCCVSPTLARLLMKLHQATLHIVFTQCCSIGDTPPKGLIPFFSVLLLIV